MKEVEFIRKMTTTILITYRYVPGKSVVFEHKHASIIKLFAQSIVNESQ